MDDWTFSRPLPPGAFPDEDHLAGAPQPAKANERELDEQARQAEALRSS
jgi:hypothetical protein